MNIDQNGNLVFGARFPLPGEIQTVARGELLSLVMLIRQARSKSVIVFWTDNKGVSDKFNAGIEIAELSSNCDLFSELFELLRQRGIHLTVRWMPSHLSDPSCKKQKPDHVSDLDIIGNDLADKLAGEAADEVQVSLHVSTQCIYYYKLVRDIQLRLITIVMHLPDRIKHRTMKTPKEEQQTLEEKCRESKHVLERQGDRFLCSQCRDSFKLKDPAFQSWLAGQCLPLVSTNKPKPINNFMHVGNNFVNHTHKLKVHRGLVYCAKCGCRATNQLRHLAKACIPPGAYGLRAIMGDKLPTGLDQWPDSA